MEKRHNDNYIYIAAQQLRKNYLSSLPRLSLQDGPKVPDACERHKAFQGREISFSNKLLSLK